MPDGRTGAPRQPGSASLAGKAKSLFHGRGRRCGNPDAAGRYPASVRYAIAAPDVDKEEFLSCTVEVLCTLPLSLYLAWCLARRLGRLCLVSFALRGVSFH